MMAQQIINHELIGLETQIVDSSNKSLVGLSGKIIDETKFMLIIETKNGTKMIPKQHNNWKFTANDQECVIDGKIISKRPEDRIKVKL